MTESKNLVAYFSASGITKKVAQNIARVLKSDIYEIKPLNEYTEADLNWLDQNARSTLEMKDWSSRPEIIKGDIDIKQYDTIFIGFPIWWYVAPTIINTFLEAYDFSNKKIVFFATSGGSGFGSTIKNLQQSIPDSAKVIMGEVLNHNPGVDKITQWIESLNL